MMVFIYKNSDNLDPNNIKYMKKTIKIFAIIGIVIGSLAIIGCVDEFDGAAFIGGLMFLSWGILDLNFINSLKK